MTAGRSMMTFDLNAEEHRVVCEALFGYRQSLLDSEQLAAVASWRDGYRDAPEAMASAVAVLGAGSPFEASRLVGPIAEVRRAHAR